MNLFLAILNRAAHSPPTLNPTSHCPPLLIHDTVPFNTLNSLPFNVPIICHLLPVNEGGEFGLFVYWCILL